MSGHPGSTRRDISHNAFNDHTRIHQGDVHINHYSSPRPTPHTGVIRVIPYPRNEDLIHRRDLIDKLDELLPSTPESCSAALWGLGGSGKTQIALNYAYRRCDTDQECCVFWVHAENETTFAADYKAIGTKLGFDEQLDGTRLLNAVRTAIEAMPKWLMIIDNADNLSLFGVGRQAQAEDETEQQGNSMRYYIPCSPQGTVLWTSRDGHIAGTLVGASRCIKVQSMAVDEARHLLGSTLDNTSTTPEMLRGAGTDALLEELQYLPLAISQAGAYMKRLSMTAEEYLNHLNQGKTRWEVLKVSDTDRHRRPEVSNSVLETWKISTEQIRAESKISYHVLHVTAYVDNQDIPEELLVAAAYSFAIDEDQDEHENEQGSGIQISEFEALQSVARLQEFSFLNLRRTEGCERRYEMHKLVQEAIRYDLRIRSLSENTTCSGTEQLEAFYSAKSLHVVDDLFPTDRKRTSWVQCEKYVTHAIRVGEWAELSSTEVRTASLLQAVAIFLYDRGRWREIKSLFERVWSLRRDVLGEKHLDTIMALQNSGLTYNVEGQYAKVLPIYLEVLQLRRQVLGEEDPSTLISLGLLGSAYFELKQYNKAEILHEKALELQRVVLGEKHIDTIQSMRDLGYTYLRQGRLNKSQEIAIKALEITREVLRETNMDTIDAMELLAQTYIEQGQYKEGEVILVEALSLGKDVLTETHPTILGFMADLALIYKRQGRYNDAESLYQTVLDLRRQVLGDNHPKTLSVFMVTEVTWFFT
ncbi:hypothetical protein FGSG_02411 [Fusarium graminearum PH-1]|uniref:hypothetical protein n=1 Tax=Gibberella zeae (strain ATCC MYA-4620 / CBS 123657 / FGSC 9075 / NRRL 31084 / PH-1) TaxID=229533 RepID=UPI000023EC3B|nr:hypothetical protein FGSG_02411 [Fusarium graminearum PH-1]ESU07843.1 hypothetical protein FGSG_02411 [Fusarium graminearum PH-1]|eukprot:XP_011318328.1 hypothetical protein FGSG_02411 [Fusarium graminearum PH-1]